MALLLVLFFFSGACGLAYQVLWMRQLSFVFGVTAYAASTVLAAFMAGLALGSWLAGPLLARIKRPLRAFGVAEIVIGVAAVSTPAALAFASSIYRALYGIAPDSFFLQTAARFACAFSVLLVPTMLMGLTLPLLSASTLVRGERSSSRIGALYALNTAGAVTGALLTGFVLIGALGMRRTYLAAALLNTLVGIGAIVFDHWLAGRSREPAVDEPVDASGPRPSAPLGAARTGTLWAVMAVSGFGALALEVVWFRVMTQYADATTYAFTSMLAAVLVGIAIGGAMVSPLLAHDRDWYGWLALNQLVTGLLVLIGVVVMVRDSASLVEALPLHRGVLLTVFMPSLFLGISFPLLLKLGIPSSSSRGGGYAADGDRGRMVGRFYGVNVLGAIFGSLAGGFFILPVLGTRLALIVLAGLFVASGLALCLTHPRRARMGAVALAGVALFAAVAVRTPDPLLAAAVAHTGTGSPDTLFLEEGVQTTVSVHPTQVGRTLFVSGLHQANDSEDMVRLHRSIGILPMALHKSPKSVLVIGLGGGATAGAASHHGGASVQIVELSDSVRKAAAFFAHVNYDVLNQPNVRMRVDDGRNFLLLSGEHFDVITADVIQPVHAGAGGLYSREYFQLVRKSLNPGGLVMQWISKARKSHYVLIMRTFLDVFPNATLWLDGNLMVGSVEPMTLDRSAFEAQLLQPQARQVLTDVGLGSYAELRSWYTAGPKEIAAFVGPGLVLTDDRPLVEYHRSLPPEDDSLDLKRIKGDAKDVEQLSPLDPARDF